MILRIVSLFILFLGIVLQPLSAQINTDLWDIFDDNNSAQENIHEGDSSYLGQWLTVDSLEKYDYLKSADSIVKNIYQQAWADKNYPSAIKSLLYQLKYQKRLDEKNLWYQLQIIDAEIEKIPAPHKNVLQSIMGSAWLVINNGDEKVEFDNTDIAPDSTHPDNWSEQKLLNKIESYFAASIKHKELLKKISINQYKALLNVPENAERYQPTLFDVLIWRAFTFYKDEAIFSFGETTNYPSSVLYGDIKSFIAYNFNDSLPLTYNKKILLLLQEIQKHNYQIKATDALVWGEITRIENMFKFCKNCNTDSLKNIWYTKHIEEYKNHRSVVELYYYGAKRLACANNYTNYRTERFNRCNNALALKYCQAAINSFPNEWTTEKCRKLISEIKEIKLTVKAEHTYEAEQPFKFFIEYNNIDTAFIRFIAISDDSLSAIKKRVGYNNDSAILQELLLYPVAANMQQKLPNDSTYFKNSTELYYKGLPQGYYIMLVSAKEDFSGVNNVLVYNGFWSTKYAVYSTHTGNKNYTYFVADMQNNKPLKGAKVVFTYYDFREEKKENRDKTYIEGITDENGAFSFKAEKSISVDAHVYYKGKKVIATNGSNYLHYYKSGRSISNINTYFYTDRNIYRPGQTVYFKGITVNSIGNTNNLVVSKTFNVELKDVNGEEVAKGEYTSNAYGSFSGSFVIPFGRATGYYTLKSKYGSIGLSVEEYKRPKFEIKFDAYKETATFGDTVTINGKAIAFAGNALSGSKLKYKVTRSQDFYSYTKQYGLTGDEEKKIISTGETELNANGVFTINFLAEGGYNKTANYKYTIEAIVTDITGETHNEETTVTIGKSTVYAKINMDDEVFASPKTEINITAKNLNNQPIPLKGKLKIQTVNVPEKIYSRQFWDEPLTPIIDAETHKKLFPYFALNGEDERKNYPVGKTVYSQTINDSTGNTNAIWNTSTTPSGLYLFTFTYLDNLGDTQTTTEYVALLNPKNKKAFPHQYFSLNAQQKSYQPNQVAEVILSSRFPKTRVIYFIDKQGEAGKMQQITLKNAVHKIKIPVTDADRGGIHITAFTIYNNRFYKEDISLQVPHSNKDLKVEVSTYRDKMQPNDKEEWQLKISGENAKQVSAEIVAAMYDASLDKIKESYWNDFTTNYRNYWRQVVSPEQHTQAQISFNEIDFFKPIKFDLKEQKMPTINFYNWIKDGLGKGNYGFGILGNLNTGSHGVSGVGSYGAGPGSATRMYKARPSITSKDKMESVENNAMGFMDEGIPPPPSAQSPEVQNSFDLGAGFSNSAFIKVRRKLDETAFFYPHLQTNDSGYVIVKFVAPEALTQWKFRAFAHTKDLSSGFATISTITQKPLMVQTNMPRFLREGDEIYISAKVVNLSGKELSPNAILEIYDATTGRNIPEFNNINMVQIPQMATGGNESVKWKFKVPEGYGALKIIIKAYDGNFTDAEANTIPVLSNKILVTETKPIDFSGTSAKTYELKKLTQSKTNTTLKHHKLTVEFTSNPAWYAIQALPYMMEYPHECAEQTFNRMYANTLASYIANSSPKIKAVFDSWKLAAQKGEGNALLSNLEKNPELKALLLQETPWLAKGKNESQRKMALGKLFDKNHMNNEINAAYSKLFDMQLYSGAFPWFSGMRENRSITQYIVAGEGKLYKLTGNKNIKRQIKEAIAYISQEAKEEYEKAKEVKNKLSFNSIQYLYAFSFFSKDIKERKIIYSNFLWLKQAQQYWQTRNLMEKAMLAIALHRNGSTNEAKKIISSLRQTSIISEENGMYWKQPTNSFAWQDAPIETQCLLIEAFSEVAKDTVAANQMRKWLLKQKQLSDWKTTRATADACYALLLNGSDWLITDNNVNISLGDKTIDPKTDDEIKVEAGTGYIKKSFSGNEINPSMGKITISPKENKEIPIAWGGLYWQYFEQLDNITYAQTPLSILKQVFIEETTDSGTNLIRLTDDKKLKAGTKLIVRILLKVNNDMEYVHLKDMRAAALEPLENISAYRWRNGVGYYKSIKDASMNYFFDKLPKGQWTFEYPLVVSQAGVFQNGIATVQSMYAPEYTSHTDGLVITVEP